MTWHWYWSDEGVSLGFSVCLWYTITAWCNHGWRDHLDGWRFWTLAALRWVAAFGLGVGLGYMVMTFVLWVWEALT